MRSTVKGMYDRLDNRKGLVVTSLTSSSKIKTILRWYSEMLPINLFTYLKRRCLKKLQFWCLGVDVLNLNFLIYFIQNFTLCTKDIIVLPFLLYQQHASSLFYLFSGSPSNRNLKNRSNKNFFSSKLAFYYKKFFFSKLAFYFLAQSGK